MSADGKAATAFAGEETALARPRPDAVYGPRELTIVAPTFNEAANILPFIESIDEAMSGVRWEIVFVDDDSKDGTGAAVVDAARGSYPNVRLISRIGRRGLSTAVIEGALSSTAPYIAVIDADMQHDERLLADMLLGLRSGDYDLAIGTRYADGGGTGEWSASRVKISRFATTVAQAISRTQLSDPMSGFFMITRDAFLGAVRDLSGQGFKILLDLVISSKAPLRTIELPYQFRARQAGESKLDSMAAVEFGMLLLDKTIGRFMPVRFFFFAAVGCLGLVVHMMVLALFFQAFRFEFIQAQSIATIVAMSFNFFVNNYLTYRDRRLKGAKGLLLGLLTFYAACSLGAVANVGIANFVFTNDYSWWLAGIAGTLVGAVWNYASTSIFTWRPSRT